VERAFQHGDTSDPETAASFWKPRRRWRRRFTALAAAGDAVSGSFAGGVLLWQVADHASPLLWLLPVVAGILWTAWLSLGRAYDWMLFGEGVEEYRRVGVAGLVAVGTVAVAATVFEFPNGQGMVLGLMGAAILTLIWRRVLRAALVRRRRKGQGMNRAVLVGPSSAVEATARLVSHATFHGTKVVGALVPLGDRAPDAAFVPAFAEGTDVTSAVQAFDADEVILLRSVDLESPELRELMWGLAERDVNLLIKPMSLHVAGPRLHVRPVDGLPLLQIAHPQIAGLARTVKGAIDRTTAALGLLLLAPVMLTISLLVLREDGGPVLYRQIRIGEDGKPFPMLKFRSMHVDADQRLAEVQANNVHPDGVHIAIINDPRVTRIGRIIRRYSLDELPQLVNVLRGEMALVGPRPPLPREVEAYPQQGWFRLAVRPGMTGLWQIQGAQRHHLSLDEALELDLRYVENWSLAYDMAILWKTMAVVFQGSGEVKPVTSSSRTEEALPPIPGPLTDLN
jgi:exopolysaccharide biosynthesis polyprenyl glycosylphosphotransferase